MADTRESKMHAGRTWAAAHDPLPVAALADPVVEGVGYRWNDPYVETFWLPSLGPSATWTWRRLAALAEAAPGGVTVPLDQLAAELGISHRGGAHSTVCRSLGRLVAFYAADVTADRFLVRTALPPLTARQADRLPAHLRGAHRLVLAGRAA